MQSTKQMQAVWIKAGMPSLISITGKPTKWAVAAGRVATRKKVVKAKWKGRGVLVIVVTPC